MCANKGKNGEESVSVAVISNRTSRSKPRCGRSPSERIPRRQNPKSMTVSVILLIAVFTFIIGFIVVLSIIVGRPASSKPPTPPVTSSGTPEVTSSACHVVGNGTTCFRFASKFTTPLCLAVDGVIVNTNSSLSTSSTSSSTSSSSSSAAALSTICYHNICTDYVVDNRFCFLNRTQTLNASQCVGIGGYFVSSSPGQDHHHHPVCYYNTCTSYVLRC